MLHCNGIDPFVTLMGNFNWGPISRNDIVSKLNTAVESIMDLLPLMSCLFGIIINVASKFINILYVKRGQHMWHKSKSCVVPMISQKSIWPAQCTT